MTLLFLNNVIYYSNGSSFNRENISDGPHKEGGTWDTLKSALVCKREWPVVGVASSSPAVEVGVAVVVEGMSVGCVVPTKSYLNLWSSGYNSIVFLFDPLIPTHSPTYPVQHVHAVA